MLFRELQKLSEDALNRQPEDVFDIVTKLGEGSYGSVYKSIHKESRQVLAIKQVPVDTDLQEIIKEISIMQQVCSSLQNYVFLLLKFFSFYKGLTINVSSFLRISKHLWKGIEKVEREAIVSIPYW